MTLSFVSSLLMLKQKTQKTTGYTMDKQNDFAKVFGHDNPRWQIKTLEWASDCCSAIFQLYHGKNKLIFNEMMMRSAWPGPCVQCTHNVWPLLKPCYIFMLIPNAKQSSFTVCVGPEFVFIVIGWKCRP